MKKATTPHGYTNQVSLLKKAHLARVCGLSLSKKYVMPAKRALKSVFCHGSAGAKNTSIRTSVRFDGLTSNRARSADVSAENPQRGFSTVCARVCGL